jgi:hypothetical protein
MSWRQALVLHPNEHVVNSWEGTCERHGVKGGAHHDGVEGKKVYSGTLALTSQRLMWFERGGSLYEKMRASFEIDLKNLEGLTSGGVTNKWVSITADQAEYVFYLEGVGAGEIEPFRNLVVNQMEKAKAVAVSADVPAPVQVGVITREVVMVPCQHCNELMAQTAKFCSNCGAKRKTN